MPEYVALHNRRPRIASPLPEAALPEPTGAGDAPPWLEPYPDVLLDHLVDQRPGPGARSETIVLAPGSLPGLTK